MKLRLLLLRGIVVLTSLCTGLAFGQNQLQFSSVNATVEGAIQLHWASNPKEYYEIDYADSLLDTNTGSTTWNFLYGDYPSQGTNTLWLDTGNYFIDPEVVHPSLSSARFYRIVLSGTNTAPAPSVSITSPTSGSFATNNINVTVLAGSVEPFVLTKLYVDGQEMQDPSSSSNFVSNGTNYVLATYVLNTCEWPNGSHTLFATAECQSGPSGTHDIPAPLIGRAASAFVPIIYTNLITRVAFSQPFFMPEDGQTQVVSAVFAVPVSWTLQIQNASSNTVRYVTGNTGSNATMVFNWDGTGTNSVTLPVGNYTYLITVQTNGQALVVGGGGGTINTNPPPPPGGSRVATISGADGTTTTVDWYPMTEQEATSAGWDRYFVQLPPLPPVKTNGVWVAADEVYGPEPLVGIPVASFSSCNLQMAQAQYSGSSSQSTRAPVRPPTAPTRGRAGYFGVAYDTYRGVASGYTVQNPDNGLHLGIKIGMEGYPGGTSFKYTALMPYISEAHNFIVNMKRGNWSTSFDRFDDALSINDLRGSGANIFNNVKLGLLMLHGTYGSDPDYTANQCEQMYFPVTSGSSAQYLRMSEMNLGSSDPNGLKWMAIGACNSLYQNNWFNMQNAGIQPFNSNLHLLLGSDSVVWTGEHVMSNWARYMTQGKIVLTPMTIQNAWFQGARDAYAETSFNYTNTQYFAITGDAACVNDMLQTNSAPTGTTFYNSQQVWP